MKIVHLLVIVTGLLASSPAMASEESPQQRVTQADPAPIEISAYDSCIHVKNAPIGSILEIYSVVGIKVKEIKIKESNGFSFITIFFSLTLSGRSGKGRELSRSFKA